MFIAKTFKISDHSIRETKPMNKTKENSSTTHKNLNQLNSVVINSIQCNPRMLFPEISPEDQKNKKS